jgi:hypothetical protein
MPHTLMPTPEDPRPDVQALLVDDLLGIKGRAVADFPRGEYATARSSAPTIDPGTARRQPDEVATQGEHHEPRSHDDLPSLPAPSHGYATVEYDAASARLVHRVAGLFANADRAETYARDCGYHLPDIVPATAVVPRTAT